MNEVLMGIVVDLLAFFELSENDTIDPRLAVNWLESISYELNKLEPGDRDAFITFVSRRADAEEGKQLKDFLRALPKATGLIEE